MFDIEKKINRIKTLRNSYFTYGTESKEGKILQEQFPLLAAKAKSTVRNLDPMNELTFLLIKSKNNEIMVAPDKEFLLIVVQGPKEEKKEQE